MARHILTALSLAAVLTTAIVLEALAQEAKDSSGTNPAGIPTLERPVR
jgi:hypothetical protein